MSDNKLIAQYEYVDPSSRKVLAVKCRYADKSFEWMRPDAKKPGLGSGLKEADLPLYNAHRLQDWDREDVGSKVVFFVEGEKAAIAISEMYGATAVCLPGGAGTRKFGDALGLLRSHDVVLWADNDEAGRELMRRVKAELMPIVERVRVYAPAYLDTHSDVYDYLTEMKGGFPAKRLQKEIKALADEPSVEKSPDGYLYDYPDVGQHVRFRFRNTRYQTIYGQYGMWADLSVWEDKGQESPKVWEGHISFRSGDSRDKASKSLQNLFGGDLQYWTQLVHSACTSVIKRVDADESYFVDLSVAPASPVVTYIVDKFLPDTGATIFFGRGDRGKTTLVTLLGLCVASGTPFLGKDVARGTVIYVNFEGEDDDDGRRRVNKLAKAAGIPPDKYIDSFLYKNARGQRLEQIAPNLREQIDELGASLVIIDSISKVSMNDIERHDAPNQYFSLIDTLKIPTLSIAHVVKPQNGKADTSDPQYPFGSTFWRDLARAGWQVHRANFSDPAVMHLKLLHRKYNTTGEAPPIGVRMEFDEPGTSCRVSAEDLDSAFDTGEEGGETIKRKIVKSLDEEEGGYPGMNKSQIAEETGANPGTVASELSRLVKRGVLVNDNGKYYVSEE